MKSAAAAPWLLAFALAGSARADDPPLIEHQPNTCTVPGKPFTLCAQVSDDVQVARVFVYFRRQGETFYSYALAGFDGTNFCATLPAPRAGKVLEYYVQASDSAHQLKRSNDFPLQVAPPERCSLAPVERDPEKTAALTVYGTNQKQKKLSDAFEPAGVKFVPVPSRR